MKERVKPIQKWIPIDYISENGIVKLKNNTYIKILKVSPIHYNLKSNLEKESILSSMSFSKWGNPYKSTNLQHQLFF